MKVIEGLKIGNECLNKMHQVSLGGLGAEEGEPSGPRRGLVPEATAAPRPLGMRESQSLPGEADRLVRQTNSGILT